MSGEQFYMVYNPKGKAPTRKHATHAEAKAADKAWAELAAAV